jgi:exopolysaccharide biosynthesis polyprenyl glycosylphosphotransferase
MSNFIRVKKFKNLIIFADDKSERFIDAIVNHKEWGVRIIMIITDSDKIRAKYNNIRIMPNKISIRKLLEIDIIDEVVYCRSPIGDKQIFNFMWACKELGIPFSFDPLPTDIHLTYANLDGIEGIKKFRINSLKYSEKTIKPFFDIIISLGIILVFFPLFIIIAILIKSTSEGPIIFKQERVGLRGRKFYIYKFRTMIKDAAEHQKELEQFNEADGCAFKIKNDKRITKIGKILRKYGLDEFPQLYNVLKGDMSLIGPRPPLPSEVAKYERWYLKRLCIKPGITCTWQVIPNRNTVLFDKWMKMDIQYIDSWSLKKDLFLVLKTIKTFIFGTGY